MVIYTFLKLCESPDVERRAHVGQLIRYRGGDAQDLDEEESDAYASAMPTADTREIFGKMREGRFVMFVIKGESPSNLRIAEVLKKEEDLVKLWYYVDRTVKNYDNAELTPGLRRVVPEWYDKSTGQVNLRPTLRDLNRGNLVKRADCLARGEIETLMANCRTCKSRRRRSDYTCVRSLSNVRCGRCRARQYGLAEPVGLARE